MSSTHALPKGRRRRRAVWIGGGALTALLLAAGTAFAAVATIPSVSPVGSAGYEATTAAPGGFTDSQAVVTPDQYGLTVQTPGAHGVFLCDTSTGLAAQAGQVSSNLNTDYSVVSVVGNPAGGCPNHGLAPSPVTFPGLSAVPFGHHVWTDVTLATRTKTIRILVCILFDRHHPERPVPTPTATNPIVTPSATESVAAPTASATDTTSPSASPSESPSVDNSLPTPTVSPTVNPLTGEPSFPLPGFGFKCRIITKTITKQVVLFQAQDLDAPTVTPLAGDLAGVQTRTVRIPRGTVFDSAGAGVTQNLTGLVPCAGAGFPLLLSGPASYTTRACQPLTDFEHATATVAGSGQAFGYNVLNSTEVVSPNAVAATMAPNNSLRPTSTGPIGGGSNASSQGSSFEVFSANAPTT